MPVKIRLQRRGRKFSKIYSIVVADSRAPRDGKYIETLGQYDPNTNPATIVLDFDKALEWLQKGAQPTDTCRAILSYKGVMYKKHLMEGVKKGAFDEAEAELRFQNWTREKENKIQSKIDKLKTDVETVKKEKLAAETEVKEKRALELEKQRAAMLKAESAADDAEEPTEEAAAEAIEEPAVEETVVAVEEEAAPSEEPTEEEEKATEAEEPEKEEKATKAEVESAEETEEPVIEEEPVAEEKKVEADESAGSNDDKEESPEAEEKTK
jgi:small subunit ribosomal protein S16